MSSFTFPDHIRPMLTRRDILARAGHGFGAIALGSLLGSPARAISRVNPLAPKASHFAPKAKSVIFLFMVGGPSQIETFDPKPELERMHGQPLPASFGTIKSQFTNGGTPLMGPAWKFKKFGQSGIDVSD